MPKGPIHSGTANGTYDNYFEFAETDRSPAYTLTLTQNTAYLEADPGIRLEVSTHTDGIGLAKSNLLLSQGGGLHNHSWWLRRHSLRRTDLVNVVR